MTAQQWCDLAMIVAVLGIFAYRVFALHPDPIRGWIVVRRKSPSEQRDEALALAMDRRFRQGMELAAMHCESICKDEEAAYIRAQAVPWTSSTGYWEQLDKAVPIEFNSFDLLSLQQKLLEMQKSRMTKGSPGEVNTAFRAGMEWSARKCEEMSKQEYLGSWKPSLTFAAKLIRMQKVNYPQYFMPSDWAELTRDE